MVIKTEITKEVFESFVPAAKMPERNSSVFTRLEMAFERAYDGLVRSYIGQTYVDSLETEEKSKENVKALVCILAFIQSARSLDLVLTSTGFGIVRTDSTAPASQERVDALLRQMRLEQYERIEVLIKDLIAAVDGTIVECNTAYGNAPEDQQDERSTSENHWKVIERHGFTPRFRVDIMDEEGETRIPVRDTTHIKYDIVGGHLADYDFMIALNHFKGHPMGGYGGALKNLSIGCASPNGKAYIHSAGKMEQLDMEKLWTEEDIGDQDGFLESMAAAAQAVTDYFRGKKGIIYINVMNNMSIDCDCVDHPEPVKLEDYGILASTDPVALDQACVDIINNQEVTATNDPTDLISRIDQQHGVHTIEHAAAIGLGTRKYHIVSIDK